MRRRALLASGAALACLLLGGCSAVRPTSPAPPTVSVSAVDGVGLRQLGIQNGPEALRLPPGTKVASAIDQENVVTLFLSAPGADATLAHLRRALPAAGLRITSDANGALLFAGPGWSGSYTPAQDGTQALTLRAA